MRKFFLHKYLSHTSQYYMYYLKIFLRDGTHFLIPSPVPESHVTFCRFFSALIAISLDTFLPRPRSRTLRFYCKENVTTIIL